MAGSFEFDPNELTDLLQRNPCTADYSREEWYRVGMAVKSAGLGFEVWDAWSSAADPRYNKRSCEDTWNSFKGDGVTYKTAFQILKEHGADISRKRNTASKKKPRAAERDRVREPRRKKIVSWGEIGKLPDIDRMKLVTSANLNLLDSEEAQNRVSAYLAAHIGITPYVAADYYRFGFLTPDLIASSPELAEVAKPFSHGDWLIMPTEGKPDYFVARAVPNGDYEQWAAWGAAEYKSSQNRCKAKNPKGNKPALTNPEALNGESVFVVEGIQDEIAIRERGFNATATLGIDYTRRAVEKLRAYAGGVVVMFDSDEAGRKASKKLADDLSGACYVFDWGGIPYKDAGEWNGANPDGLSKALDHAAAQVAMQVETDEERPIANADPTAKQEQPESTSQSKAGARSFYRCPTTISLLCDWLELNLEAGSIALNAASGDIAIMKRVPWDEPTAEVPRDFHWKLDLSALTRLIDRDFYSTPTKEKLDLALTEFGKPYAFDPVKDAIGNLPTVTYNADGSTTFTEQDGETWTQPPLYTAEDLKALGEVEPDGKGGFCIRFNGDGTTREKNFRLPRVAGFVLWHVLKADLTPLTFYSECIHLCGVIARGLHHGCNYQFMLALQGNQGIGKDTYIASTSIDPDKFLSSGNTSKAIRTPEDEAVKSAGKLVHNFHEF